MPRALHDGPHKQVMTSGNTGTESFTYKSFRCLWPHSWIMKVLENVSKAKLFEMKWLIGIF